MAIGIPYAIIIAADVIEEAAIVISAVIAGKITSDQIEKLRIEADSATIDPVENKCPNAACNVASPANVMLSEAAPTEPTSPDIAPDEITDKTDDEIRELAKEKGLIPDEKKPNKWKDPITGKERLRIDPGHVDKDTQKPYDIPEAAKPHVHAYPPNGPKSGKVIDPIRNDPHFPLKY